MASKCGTTGNKDATWILHCIDHKSRLNWNQSSGFYLGGRLDRTENVGSSLYLLTQWADKGKE